MWLKKERTQENNGLLVARLEKCVSVRPPPNAILDPSNIRCWFETETYYT